MNNETVLLTVTLAATAAAFILFIFYMAERSKNKKAAIELSNAEGANDVLEYKLDGARKNIAVLQGKLTKATEVIPEKNEDGLWINARNGQFIKAPKNS